MKVPEWWEPWHTWAVQVLGVVINVYAALTTASAIGVAAGWLLAGCLCGTMIMTSFVNRLLVMNRNLIKHVDDQRKMIDTIGQAKADEVGRQIAAHLNQLGAEIIPFPPTPSATKH